MKARFPTTRKSMKSGKNRRKTIDERVWKGFAKGSSLWAWFIRGACTLFTLNSIGDEII
ncbi:hypothetical protein MARVELLAND_61 [Bacillus phage vB_BspM_MarvelLand]|nr:hypothetical protein MARVELLAND_61 [Bacillus phage vB_BspM_MarvelLand]